MRARRGLLVIPVLLALALAACGPEADRGRGGGEGADVGNRDLADVKMHGDEEGGDDRDERMYYRTPDDNPAPED